MEVPVQVVLKRVPQAEFVREEVIKAAGVLERFQPRVTSCRVSVTNPGMRHRQGALFDVHVVLAGYVTSLYFYESAFISI